MRCKSLIRYFGFFTLLVWGNLSHATCTGIGCGCLVAATPMAFGVYDLFSANNSITTLTVTCTAVSASSNVSYEIQLSKGSSSTYTPRTMTSGGQSLNYNLYRDSGRTQIWGDTTGGTVDVVDSFTMLLTKVSTYTVYGQIPSNQAAGIGIYGDTITVSVIY